MAEEKFELETNTVWSFPNRGKWATHDAKYRGNFSPYIAKNIILRYSKEKDVVLDQFVGGGTTLIECKLNNRNAIGIDINPNAVEITKNKLTFNCDNEVDVDVKLGNACSLDLENESIDLISQLKYKDFLVEIEKVASECYRVLKKDKFCAIVMGDTRKNGMVQPLGFEVMQRFINAGFKQKEIIIKEQHNCKATGFWKSNSQKYNFLLLAHEYVFVFVKR